MKYVEILHQTAMCMLFVCCGCAPFETVTDEQFASQMVEFKQETLLITPIMLDQVPLTIILFIGVVGMIGNTN